MPTFNTLKQVRDELATVLSLAQRLNLHDGPLDRIRIQRGVDNWVVSDPDNNASAFLPPSKALGATKTDAWRTLYNMREILWAVATKHPEIVEPINAPPLTLPVLTTVAELEPGDVFAYSQHPGKGDRLSPVISVADIAGRSTVLGDNTYPDGMTRVIYENSDAFGTLFYAHEKVYRANR